MNKITETSNNESIQYWDSIFYTGRKYFGCHRTERVANLRIRTGIAYPLIVFVTRLKNNHRHKICQLHDVNTAL